MRVDLADLHAQHDAIRDELRAAVDQVFESCRFILGENVTEIEREIAALCGAKYGVAVNSGTDALLLAMAACGIGPGDEVITTPFTFVATAETICQLGATPVFADIDPITFNINPAEVKKRLTPRTKAILPVHLFGQIADMKALQALAAESGARLIGDGAQAIGATQGGEGVGAFPDLATLSFYPTKNLGACGDGGMVLTNDEAIRDELKVLRFHGSGGGYIYRRVGYCSRLDEFQAAILRVKARSLPAWNEARRRNAAQYRELLAGLDSSILLPETAANNEHIFHQFTLRVLGGEAERAALQKHLQQQEVGSAVFYPLSLHLQEAYRFLGAKEGDFPNSETATAQVLSLPVHPDLTDAQVAHVAAAVRSFFGA